LVERVGGDVSDLMTSAPVFIAEVLSPSTAEIDLGDKATEYLQLPSLSAYLVLAQDIAKAWIWRRGAKGFPLRPRVIVGLDKVLKIGALNVTCPLAAVYAGVLSETEKT
jgi:Uma2 family endonuclease